MASLRALQLADPAPLQPNYLGLRYRADVHLLTARWQRPVTAAELRAGYAAALQLACSAQCPYWLVDLRGRTPDNAVDTEWLTAAFLPELPIRLGQPVYLAFLLPPHFHPPFGASPGAAGFVPASALTVRFFNEEGPLTAWLLQCQLRS